MNVLLLENRFKKKYRNLGLMKFSTYYKNKNWNVDFFSGIDKRNTLKDAYDEIIFSTIFTFHFEDDIKTIQYYQQKYPKAKFRVGGISATLMSDKFFEQTGIMPHSGIYDEIDQLCPDYNLFPNHKMADTSLVFTSRGCRNKCGFCAVKKLEPTYHINEKWQDSIDLSKPKAMLHDNNLTTGDFNHFKKVMSYLKQHKLNVIFDNGFDCRFFTDDHLREIIGVKFDRCGLRFAFDNMDQDKLIQDTIKKCLDAGITKSKIMVYVLYNYKDTFEEAMYRADEIRKLGCRPYPQQYRPLDDIEYKNKHVSKHWNKKLLRNYRFYWMMPGIYGKQTWDTYIINGGVDAY